MSNPIIETDIAEILKKLGDNQEKILEKINNIDSRLVRVETKLDSVEKNVGEIKPLGDRLTKIESGQGKIEEKLNSQGKIVEDLKTSQKNQICAFVSMPRRVLL